MVASSYVNHLASKFDETSFLDSEIEKHLILRAQNGCLASRNKIIESQMRFIITCARNYVGMNTMYSIEDIINEFSIVAHSAINTFDTTIGTKFSTHLVYQIKNNTKFLHEKQSIRVPSHWVKEKVFVDSKTGEEYSIRKDSEGNVILDEDGKVKKFAPKPKKSNISSLDQKPSDDSKDSYSDMLSEKDDFYNHRMNSSDLYDVKDIYNKALGLFKGKERKILQLYTGFDTEPMSYQEIGNELGMSRQSIFNIMDKMMLEVRRTFNNDEKIAYKKLVGKPRL